MPIRGAFICMDDYFAVIAAVMVLLGLYHIKMLPSTQVPRYRQEVYPRNHGFW